MKINYLHSYLLLCVLLALASCATIKPEAPAISSNDIPPAEQQTSEIDIPIVVPLQGYLQKAENSVPNVIEGKENPCEGLRYSYQFKRAPFKISGGKNTIGLTIDGQYKFEGSYCAKCLYGNCIAPLVSISCGYNEPMRRITIGYNSSFKIMPDYKIKSNTALTTLDAIDKCKITVLNLDVTKILIKEIREPLTKLGAEVDKKVAEVDLKSQIEPFWEMLSKEIKLDNYGYLNLHPMNPRISDFTINQSDLKFNIGFSANPMFTTESHSENPLPLPNLKNYNSGDGFNINLELEANYDTLSKYINKQIAGKVFTFSNKNVIINNVKVYGIGNSKLVAAITFTGSKKGLIYLIGTPAYDPKTYVLSVPDFAFDVKTKDMLLKMAKWLFSDKITTTLREKSKYTLKPLFDQTKTRLQKELNRDINEYVGIKGGIDEINLQGIYPAKDKLAIRAISKGYLEVLVKKDMDIK